jgi:hypothetical protein
MAPGSFDEERPKIHISIELTQSEAVKLLEELADEASDLRRELQQDPRAVLKRLPIEISPDRIPDTVELPPPTVFGELVDRIARGEFRAPSVPAGYALFMMVLPFSCPTSDSD